MLDLGLPRHPWRVPIALISGPCAHCMLTCSASELIQALTWPQGLPLTCAGEAGVWTACPGSRPPASQCLESVSFALGP